MNFNDQSRYCHAERSEASVRPSRQTLRCAQGDKLLPVLVVNVHYRALEWGCRMPAQLPGRDSCYFLPLLFTR